MAHSFLCISYYPDEIDHLLHLLHHVTVIISEDAHVSFSAVISNQPID
jgi:hypothetical protein